jgi:hypothetical protein
MGMSVIKNIAAIAKGMSITFMEMFQPTTVENYPDGPGPLRGAKRMAWRSVSPVFFAQPTARRIASISRRQRTRLRNA